MCCVWMARGLRKNEPSFSRESRSRLRGKPASCIVEISFIDIISDVKGQKAGAEERLATQVRNGTDFS